MREADKAEAWAAFLAGPAEIVQECERSSPIILAGRVSGEAICLFGVARGPALLGYGLPWMIGTEGVERHARIFLRHSRPYVAAMRAEFPRLVNYVDARNVLAVRWLKWLGFAIEDAKPYGALQRPFHRFTMEN